MREGGRNWVPGSLVHFRLDSKLYWAQTDTKYAGRPAPVPSSNYQLCRKHRNEKHLEPPGSDAGKTDSLILSLISKDISITLELTEHKNVLEKTQFQVLIDKNTNDFAHQQSLFSLIYSFQQATLSFNCRVTESPPGRMPTRWPALTDTQNVWLTAKSSWPQAQRTVQSWGTCLQEVGPITAQSRGGLLYTEPIADCRLCWHPLS